MMKLFRYNKNIVHYTCLVGILNKLCVPITRYYIHENYHYRNECDKARECDIDITQILVQIAHKEWITNHLPYVSVQHKNSFNNQYYEWNILCAYTQYTKLFVKTQLFWIDRTPIWRKIEKFKIFLSALFVHIYDVFLCVL